MKTIVVLHACVALALSAAAMTAEFALEVAATGHAGEMKRLLDKGFDPSAADSLGTTPLMQAAKHDNFEVVRLLLDRGVPAGGGDSLGRDALDWALVSGSRLSAALLVDRGADPNRVDRHGNPRLVAAALRGDLSAVGFLLVCGADRDARSGEGLDALAAAGRHGHEAIVSLLREFQFAPPAREKPKGLSLNDSLDLYAVTSYPDAETFFNAVQRGRRHFEGCTLSCLDLSYLNLSFLDFSGAFLESSDMRASLCIGADFRQADLRAAYLKRSDLTGANLDSALVAGAYLNEADLTGARGATAKQMQAARSLYKTVMDQAIIDYLTERRADLFKDPGSAWDTNLWAGDAGKRPLSEIFKKIVKDEDRQEK